jgi:hypothetical protein
VGMDTLTRTLYEAFLDPHKNTLIDSVSWSLLSKFSPFLNGSFRYADDVGDILKFFDRFGTETLDYKKPVRSMW